jgi:hypothetical protein
MSDYNFVGFTKKRLIETSGKEKTEKKGILRIRTNKQSRVKKIY